MDAAGATSEDADAGVDVIARDAASEPRMDDGPHGGSDEGSDEGLDEGLDDGSDEDSHPGSDAGSDGQTADAGADASCPLQCGAAGCSVPAATASTLAAGTRDQPIASFAIAPDALYVGTVAKDIFERGQLRKRAFSTGAWSVVLDHVQVSALAIGGAFLYYQAHDVQSDSSRIYSLGLAGDGPYLITSEDVPVSGLTASDSQVYYQEVRPKDGVIWAGNAAPLESGFGRAADVIGTPDGFSLDATDIFWATRTTKSFIFHYDLRSYGPPVPPPVLQSDDVVTTPVIDGANLYFIDRAPSPCAGDVKVIPRGGGAAATVSIGGTGGGATSLAVDSGFVYWATSYGGGAVFRAAKHGGTPAPIAVGQGDPTSIRTDATRVYWLVSAGGAGEVRAVSK